VRCFVVAGFLLTSASRGRSTIAEPLVVLNGSNDADSRKGVVFLAFVDIAPHLEDQTAKKP